MSALNFNPSTVSISASFDGGAIEVESIQGHQIDLKVPDDPFTELEQKHHKMWFYFRGSGFQQAGEEDYNFRIVNAGECSYPTAWEGYNVCASYDSEEWFRIPCVYKDQSLCWDFKPAANQCFFAYFPPYSHERHLGFLGKCNKAAQSQGTPTSGETGTPAQNVGSVSVRSLGATLDGRSMDLVTIGHGPRKIWCVGRQHPGETMAEFFMEGYVLRLLNCDDPVVRRLRREATFYCVPSMNPDGALRGHLRTNACGANLNREWAPSPGYPAPSLERSPEVYHVLAEMDRVGCDMFIDVHGDEELPYTFLAGMEGLEVWGPRLMGLQDVFSDAFKRASPDFQTEVGYEADPPLEANLCIGSNQVAQRFDCLGFTLEMPFKDTAADPNPITGWSPQRSQVLGGAILTAVDEVVGKLRW